MKHRHKDRQKLHKKNHPSHVSTNTIMTHTKTMQRDKMAWEESHPVCRRTKMLVERSMELSKGKRA